MVLPAIDVLEGRCVRLAGGDPGRVTIEGGDPALAAGAARVMVGTAALSPSFLADAAETFGERLVVAVDARDGKVVAEGWTSGSSLTAVELAAACAQAGVARLLVTSASRDGSLAGPDLDLLGSVIAASGLPVLAAGGIASLDDLDDLRALGCEGAVLGSALWSGRISLAEALARANPIPAG